MKKQEAKEKQKQHNSAATKESETHKPPMKRWILAYYFI